MTTVFKRLNQRAPQGALLLLALLVAGRSDAALSIAISPQVVEKQIGAGSSVADVVTFQNDSTDTLNVSIEIADFTIDVNGKPVEHPPGTEPSSLSPYFKISPTRITVAPGQEVFFRYSVDAPKLFTHLRAMLFFVCRPSQKPSGKAVTVVVPRLGVPIYIENRRATRADLIVNEVRVERAADNPNSLLLSVALRNNGERSIRPGGTIEVRSGGRTIKSMGFNDGTQPVLPGNERLFEVLLAGVGGGQLTVNLRLTSAMRTLLNRDYAVAPSLRSASP